MAYEGIASRWHGCMWKKFVYKKVSFCLFHGVKGGIVGVQRRVLLIDLFWFYNMDSTLMVESNNVY